MSGVKRNFLSGMQVHTASVALFVLVVGCERAKHRPQNRIDGGKSSAITDSTSKAPSSSGIRGSKVDSERLNDFEHVSAALDHFSTERFDQIWEAIRNLEDTPIHKQFLFERCLSQMCASGGTLRALEAVQSTFGAGDRRSVILASVFTGSSIPLAELCRIQSQLKLDADKKAASSGISSVIANLPSLESLTVDVFANLDSYGRDTLPSGLGLYVKRIKSQNGDINGALMEIFRVAKDVGLHCKNGVELERSIWEEVSAKSPFEVWQIMKSPGMSAIDEKQRTNVIRSMADIDPQEPWQWWRNPASWKVQNRYLAGGFNSIPRRHTRGMSPIGGG